jgi:hypothetical protein
LTKKDYIAISTIIRDSRNQYVRAELMRKHIATELTIYFKQENTKFDPKKFMEACEV